MRKDHVTSDWLQQFAVAVTSPYPSHPFFMYNLVIRAGDAHINYTLGTERLQSAVYTD